MPVLVCIVVMVDDFLFLVANCLQFRCGPAPLVKCGTRRLNHVFGRRNFTTRDIERILYNFSFALKIISSFRSHSIPLFFFVLVSGCNERNDNTSNEGGNQGGYTAGIQNTEP